MSAEIGLSSTHLFPNERRVLPPKLRARPWKSMVDYSMALLVLPALVVIALALIVLNPFFNPGPLIFRQERLGQGRRPFHMYKFRSMLPEGATTRGPLDGVEQDRITALGRILRKLRIDELPNFLNVLRGEMSVIGPRPDAAPFARAYLDAIPAYATRFTVKPGITGLAQIKMGYAEGIEATTLKAHYDRLYVERQGLRLDFKIAFSTVGVILSGFGAK